MKRRNKMVLTEEEIWFLIDLGSNRISGYEDDLYRQKHLAPVDEQESQWCQYRIEKIKKYKKIIKKMDVKKIGKM
jgi:hypothetical protein